MAKKTTHEEEPIDLLGEDVVRPHRVAKAALTETSNMNQRLVVMTELNPISTAPLSATKLAIQLGYDGQLTVGALEDGIRIYQRRTVEHGGWCWF